MCCFSFECSNPELAEQAGVNGIIVLISKYEGKTHIEVAAGGETLKKDFTPHDTEKLYDILSTASPRTPMPACWKACGSWIPR